MMTRTSHLLLPINPLANLIQKKDLKIISSEAVAFWIAALSVTASLLNGKGPRYYSIMQRGEKHGQ